MHKSCCPTDTNWSMMLGTPVATGLTLTNGKADREHLVKLEKGIRAAGWVRAPDQMRMFRHKTTADIIELEPGGTKIGGHFLHHMKWESM